MADLLAWLDTNWGPVAAILLAAHTLALTIVNITPTPKDDEWVSRIYRWVEILGGLVTERSKETSEGDEYEDEE